MAGSIVKIGEKILLNRIVSNGHPFTGKSKVGVGASSLSAFLFVTALGFFIYGSYVWSSANMPDDVAALYVGAMIFIVSCLFALIAYVSAHYKRKKAKELRAETMDTVMQMMDQAEGGVADLIRENPKSALFISSVVGYIVGDRAL